MNTSLTDSKLRKELSQILQAEPFSIKATVAQEAFAHSYDNIANFFSDYSPMAVNAA